MGDEDDDGIFTLATQGGISFLGKALGKGLGFAFVAVATRLVTPAEYGIYTLGLSIVMFVQGFASLNIYRSVDYFVPHFLSESEYGRAKKTLQNAFGIGTIFSITGAIVIFLAGDRIASLFNEPRLAIILPFFALLIPLQTANRTLLTSFNSIKKMKYRVIVSDLLNPLIRIIGVVVLVTGGAGLLGLVGGHLLGISTAVLLGGILLIYEADWIRNSSSTSISNWSLLSYSLPLVLAGVIYSLVGQIDFFVIGYFRDSTEVGQYRVAYLLSSNILIIITSITPIFKPMVAENRSDTSIIDDRYQLATRWVTMLTLPLAITLVLAPDIYLSFFFTEKYAVAGTAVVALTIGYLLNASFGPEGMILEGLGHTRLTLFNTFVLVGVNGLLDVLLVPEFGILGAGIATGSALTIAGLAGIVEIYYIRSIHPYNWNLLKVWIAAVFPATLGWFTVTFVTTDILLAVVLPPFVVVVYLFGLRVTGGFSEEDRHLASRINLLM